MTHFGIWLVLLLHPATANPDDPRPIHEYNRAHNSTGANCAAFLPDGKTVVLGGGFFAGPGELVYWDVATGRVTRVGKTHCQAIRAVAVSPDGKRIATGGGAGQVKLWDLDGLELADLDPGAAFVSSLAFSPDGRLLTTCADGVDPCTFKVREVATRKLLDPPGVRMEFAHAAAFAPDGKTLAVVWAKNITLLRTDTWATERTVTSAWTSVLAPLYSPDGKLLVVPESKYQPHVTRLGLWDTTTWKQTHTLPVWSFGRAFTPDGRHLLTGGDDGQVRVWDVKTGREVAGWLAATKAGKAVRGLAVSPDGTRVVTCSDDHVARLWDLTKIVPPVKQP